jgi:arylsulfatase A-like enzyme
MMEHDHWFCHGQSVHEEVIRVPLAVRFNKLTSGRVTSRVSLVDVTPTIFDAVGLPIPAGLDGQSLLAPLAPRNLFAEARGNSGMSLRADNNGGLWRCVIRGDRKMMAKVNKSGPIREQLAFDLARDPGELKPLPINNGDPLFRALADFIARDPDPSGLPRHIDWGSLPGPGVAPVSDTNTLKKVRSLGYVR